MSKKKNIIPHYALSPFVGLLAMGLAKDAPLISARGRGDGSFDVSVPGGAGQAGGVRQIGLGTRSGAVSIGVFGGLDDKRNEGIDRLGGVGRALSNATSTQLRLKAFVFDPSNQGGFDAPTFADGFDGSDHVKLASGVSGALSGWLAGGVDYSGGEGNINTKPPGTIIAKAVLFDGIRNAAVEVGRNDINRNYTDGMLDHVIAVDGRSDVVAEGAEGGGGTSVSLNVWVNTQGNSTSPNITQDLVFAGAPVTKTSYSEYSLGEGDGNSSSSAIAVPEPGSFSLFITGIFGLSVLRRLRQAKLDANSHSNADLHFDDNIVSLLKASLS